MEYKVVVSDKAKRMLGIHIRFIAQVNSNSAKTQKKKIMNALRSLSRFPQRFPFFDEIYIPKNKYQICSTFPVLKVCELYENSE